MRVLTAFPSPGRYCLWLKATGPGDKMATTTLYVSGSSGAGHGFVNVDKAIVEGVGTPTLRAPDGSYLGELLSDAVGKRVDLLFPERDADFGAALYSRTVSGRETRLEASAGASFAKTSDGWLLSLTFPKPGEYSVTISGRTAATKAYRILGSLILSSRF